MRRIVPVLRSGSDGNQCREKKWEQMESPLKAYPQTQLRSARIVYGGDLLERRQGVRWVSARAENAVQRRHIHVVQRVKHLRQGLHA